MRKFTLIPVFSLLMLFSTGMLIAQTTIVKGTIEYHDDWGISDARLYLIDVNTNAIIDSTIADSLGNYVFDTVTQGAYVVVSETDLTSGGVDLADALRIIYHLSPGVNLPLDSLEYLAADVNGDDTVTFVDAYTILMYWASQVGYGNKFNFTVGDWVFDAGFDKDTFYITQTNDTVIYGISGSSTGDVNGSYTPEQNPSPDIIISPGQLMRISAQGIVDIPLRFDCPMMAGAAGLIFNYSPQILEIHDITSPHQGLFHEVVGDKIYVIWFNENGTPLLASSAELFITIHAKLKPGFTRRSINIGIDPGSHIVDPYGKLINKPVIRIPVIEIEDNDPLLGNVFPNPASSDCQVSLAIPFAGGLSMGIYDMRGVLVKTIMDQHHMEAGYNDVTISVDDLEEGMYMLKATFKGDIIIEQNTKLLIKR